MRKMGIGLGVGINRSNYAQGIFGAYQSRVTADGGVTEAGACVDSVSSLLQSASLLLIPSGYKGGKLYAEIPTNGNGDLTWTRASTALRTNSSGLLESMASGVPRLSYMYGSCPSALLEPQRTNLALRSEEFDNASWLKLNSTVTANQTTSPDGTTNADKLFENATNGFHATYQSTSSTLGFFTATCYAKASERSWLILDIFTGVSGGDCLAWFDLSNGVVGSTTNGNGSSSTTSTIQSVANGWYRCSVTINKTSATAGNFSIALSTGNNVSNYAGNSSNGLFIYGAQLEAGAYPTTYIPTTSATATRVADSFSRSNMYTNGLISASGGTWFVELRNNVAYTRDSVAVNLFLGDNISSPSNGLVIRSASASATRLSIQKVISGAFTILATPSTDTIKVAFKWNGTSADVFVNGTKEVSATAYTTTNMEFLACISQIPTFIQQMALFPTPLTDTQCQTLTT